MALSILAGLSILMIGDSHLATPNYLIGTLHDNLVQQGAQVHTLGICGSNPGDWLKRMPSDCGGAERKGKNPAVTLGKDAATQPIAQMIATDKPDLVLVVMGDNLASYDKPSFAKSWAWQQTTSLNKAIAATGTQCIWIGPNWGSEGGKYGKTYARVKMIAAFLGSNVAPCGYIDSLQFSKPGQWTTVDGQHLTANAYKHWADAISAKLVEMPLVKAAKQ